MDSIETAFYLRMRAVNHAGVLAEVTKILGDRSISIEAFIQKEPAEDVDKVDIILLTHRVNEGDMNAAIKEIEALEVITGEVMRIRVESLK
jgi:homoserine dehydrogenase